MTYMERINSWEFLKDLEDSVGYKYTIYIQSVSGIIEPICGGIIEYVEEEDNTIYIKLEGMRNLERFPLDSIKSIERNGGEYKIIYNDDSFFIVTIV